MSKYTPTTEVVKVRYAIGHGGLSDDVEDMRAEDFDRWLAAEKAKWQAEAWVEGFAAFAQWHARHPIDDHKPEPTNPYEKGSDDDR